MIWWLGRKAWTKYIHTQRSHARTGDFEEILATVSYLAFWGGLFAPFLVHSALIQVCHRATIYIHAYSTISVRSSLDTRFPTTSSPHPPCLSSTNSLSRVQSLSSALTIDQNPILVNKVSHSFFPQISSSVRQKNQGN